MAGGACRFRVLSLTRPAVSLAEAGAINDRRFSAATQARLTSARAPMHGGGGIVRMKSARRRSNIWGVSRISTPSEQAPSAWAATFARMLETAGWPGETSLDSAEHQTVEAWKDLLRRFGSLDVVSPPLPLDEAVARLRELAAATEFQPEDLGAPIQITGALEAAGAEFDHLGSPASTANRGRRRRTRIRSCRRRCRSSTDCRTARRSVNSSLRPALRRDCWPPRRT